MLEIEHVSRIQDPELVKVSVITVTYNCEATIGQTMQSVLSQKHQNIEYLIIDGCSTDSTPDIVRQTMDQRVRLFIGKDEGIYDAMNKGLMHVTGDLVSFLNSGDYFCDDTVLDAVASAFVTENAPDVIYGDIRYYSDTGETLMSMERKTPLHVMTRFLCHQALFVRRSSFAHQKPFNTRFRVYADYDWLLSALCSENLTFFHINAPVVYYQAGGFSQHNVGKYAHERLAIIRKFWNCTVNLRTFLEYPLEILYLSGILLFLLWHRGLYLAKTRFSG
jgi:glycosyltransferase involved in cell wall biosynthesis